MDLNELATEIHNNAVAHGFWDGDRNFGEQIALMHSELSEALEEHRAGRPLEWRPLEWFSTSGVDVGPVPEGELTRLHPAIKPEGVAVELADCAIRALDSLAALDADLGGHMAPEALTDNFAESITRLHVMLSDAYQAELFVRTWALHQVAVTCQALAEQQGCTDWWGVVRRKMDYNVGRPMKHGKAY